MNEYSGCIGQFSPLPQIWIEFIGHKLQRVRHNGSPNCIFYAITIALNQRVDVEDTITVEKLRTSIAGQVELLYNAYFDIHNRQDPDLHNPYAEDTTGRNALQLWIDYQIYRNSNMSNIYYTIETIGDLKEYITSLDYTLKSIDIMILSRLYGVHFIILKKLKDKIPADRNARDIIENTFILTANPIEHKNYILLFQPTPDVYEIIIDTSRSPHRYIHEFNDLPHNLQDEIMRVRETQRPLYDRPFTIEDIDQYLALEHLNIPVVSPSEMAVWRTVAPRQLNTYTAEEKAKLSKELRSRRTLIKVRPSDQRAKYAEQQAFEKAEREKLAQQSKPTEKERAEQERVEQERVEQERAEEERAEQERVEPEDEYLGGGRPRIVLNNSNKRYKANLLL